METATLSTAITPLQVVTGKKIDLISSVNFPDTKQPCDSVVSGFNASVLSLIEMQITCRDLSSEKAGGVSPGKCFDTTPSILLLQTDSPEKQLETKQIKKCHILAPQVSSYLNSSASQNKSSS